jgi:tetratricopeptide (TPR) repeat protein
VHDDLYADDWGVAVPCDTRTCLPTFVDHREALFWFSAETDNLIAASRVAAETGFDEVAWKLPALLRTPYIDRHPIDEWLPMGEAALKAARRAGDGLGQAVTFIGLGVAYRQAQRVPEAIRAEQSALRAARDIGDRRQEAAALTLLGHAQRRGRQLDEACQSYAQALVVADEARLVLWGTWAMIGFAEALFDAGRLAEARARLEDIVQRLPLERYPGLRAERLWVLSSIERELGETAFAEAHVHEALDIAYETDNAVYLGEYQIELGRVLLAVDKPAEALLAFQDAVSIERRMGDCSREANALDAAGESYQALGRFDDAITLHARALTIHRTFDDRWRAAVALHNLGRAHSRIGEDDATRHYREAAELIADYTDPRAESLRDQLTTAISAGGG